MFVYLVAFCYFEGGGFSFSDILIELPHSVYNRGTLGALKAKIEKDLNLPSKPSMMNLILLDFPTQAEREGLVPPLQDASDYQTELLRQGRNIIRNTINYTPEVLQRLQAWRDDVTDLIGES